MEEKNFEIEFLGRKIPVFYIKSSAKAVKALQKLSEYDCLMGIDIETAALPEFKHIRSAPLSPHLGNIRLLQVYNQKSIVVFDLHHILGEELALDISYFVRFLESKKFIAHNAIFEMSFFAKLGVKKFDVHCSYILSKILFHATKATDEGLSASLESMCMGLFGVQLNKESQKSDWSVPSLTFEQIEYAAQDAVATFLVGEKLAAYVPKYELNKYYRLCKDVQWALCQMQLNGIGFNAETHETMIDEWAQKLFLARNRLLQLTGLDKITPTTVGQWLQNNLDANTLSIWPRTETGRLSTDADAFADFSYLKIVKPFSEYQRLDKLTSAFGENLLHAINPATKRIHPSFLLCGARTGRLSCRSPNCQQIAKGSELRNTFVAAPGKVLLRADYNQIEVRVAGEVSKDPLIREAYRKGVDIHKLTASKITGKPISFVTDSDRQAAKAVVFGSLYGIGPKKLSHYAKKSYNAEIPEEEASEVIKAFKEAYAGYYSWAAKIHEKAKTKFLTSTVMGKRRKLNEVNWFGAGPNTWIQGSAAEVMLKALTLLQESLEKSGTSAQLVNCVHDEVIVEALPEEVKDISERIQLSMECAYTELFPEATLKNLVAVTQGANWGEAKG